MVYRKTLKIAIILGIILLIMSLIFAINNIINIQNFVKNPVSSQELTTYSNEYKKTSELTDDDIDDLYQKNYQEKSLNDGSFLRKKAEWTDKEKGEAKITIQGVSNNAEESTALYIATMCYGHGLTEDILVSNILTLVQKYDKVDFIAINNDYEEGICDVKTFNIESTEIDIRNYISETKTSGMTYAHAINSIPISIQKYLFGNYGDQYINKNNLINNPTAIYVSTDIIYLNYDGHIYSDQPDGKWGMEYCTEKYFNFIEENYKDRYFTMSQYSQKDTEPYLYIRFATASPYNINALNIVIGILNPENYGKAELALSDESIKTWAEHESSSVEALSNAIYLPFTEKKYAADYNYSETFEEAGVTMVTDIAITDVVQDYYEIKDVKTTSPSGKIITNIQGQSISVIDNNYNPGDQVKVEIIVQLKANAVIDGFEDTNKGMAVLNYKDVKLEVESPKLASLRTTYEVNYLDKNTSEKINTTKIVNNIPVNMQIKALDEVIEIEGYNFDSTDIDILKIGAKNNVINIYYTKKTNLTYTVHYIDLITGEDIINKKIVTGVTYKDEIIAKNEIIEFDNYIFEKTSIDTLIIGTGENDIYIYYSLTHKITTNAGKGGTGTRFDWSLLSGMRRPFFLAGGLDMENVVEAVRRFHPYALDISSGIETDGMKDKKKMAAFAAAVRKAESLRDSSPEFKCGRSAAEKRKYDKSRWKIRYLRRAVHSGDADECGDRAGRSL